jgi:hypothetical protein
MGVPVFVLMVVYYRMSLAAGAGGEYYVGRRCWVRAVALRCAERYFARSRNEITELAAFSIRWRTNCCWFGADPADPIASPQLKHYISPSGSRCW